MLCPGLRGAPPRRSLIGDLVFLSSLHVLGGDFWDKLRALFVPGARTRFPER